MSRISPSDLFVTPRGGVYHLDLRPEELAPLVITVGDPRRVPMVSRYFDELLVRRSSREFVTHTGRIGKTRLSVVSTGIGTDNIDIVLQELDALVNIDLEQGTVREAHTSLQLIRIGTCGAIQPDLEPGAFILSSHALGLDNLIRFYRRASEPGEDPLLRDILIHTGLPEGLPYLSLATAAVLNRFQDLGPSGITVTCPGFYGPQGRMLRLGLAYPQLLERLMSFSAGPLKCLNLEMESAGLYALSHLLGHACLSLSVVVANRVRNSFAPDVEMLTDALIRAALDRIGES